MIFIFILALLVVTVVSTVNFTGNVVNDSHKFGEKSVGPSSEEIKCMQNCVLEGCEPEDRTCMEANADACGKKCNVDVGGPPEPETEEEACMQKCVARGCDEFDFECQEINKEICEDECNMKGDAPDESEMSEEQKCIYECVMEKDSSVVCGNSQEGETGGRICKRCAKQCEYLYKGPCLDDKGIKEKEKECETCKHCYGEPVMGASGEGWDCIVDLECKDASDEWGDEPGEGPGIGEEGFVNKESFTERIGGFFKGLFGGRDKKTEKESEINNELPIEEEQINFQENTKLPEENFEEDDGFNNELPKENE